MKRVNLISKEEERKGRKWSTIGFGAVAAAELWEERVNQKTPNKKVGCLSIARIIKRNRNHNVAGCSFFFINTLNLLGNYLIQPIIFLVRLIGNNKAFEWTFSPFINSSLRMGARITMEDVSAHLLWRWRAAVRLHKLPPWNHHDKQLFC